MDEEPLDARVARIVFGARVEYCSEHPGPGGAPWAGCGWLADRGSLPPYSTEIAAAWRAVERLRELGHEYISIYADANGWEVEIGGREGRPGVCGPNSPTAPLAICRAALLAVERATQGAER